MKEFMLLIRNGIDSKKNFSAERDQAFLKACEVYIERLNKNGNLKKAQPMIREGRMLSNAGGVWHDDPFNESDEVIVGYYHILANDMDEAISIAKGNPEFEYTTTARIEMRPLKMKEVATGFYYPGK